MCCYISQAKEASLSIRGLICGVGAAVFVLNQLVYLGLRAAGEIWTYPLTEAGTYMARAIV
jgi:hypothetical protein